MRNIIGVRFKKLGKIYFFNPKYLHVVKGDKVIVETAQGEETRSEQNPVSMYSGSYVRSLQSSSGK